MNRSANERADRGGREARNRQNPLIKYQGTWERGLTNTQSLDFPISPSTLQLRCRRAFSESREEACTSGGDEKKKCEKKIRRTLRSDDSEGCRRRGRNKNFRASRWNSFLFPDMRRKPVWFYLRNERSPRRGGKNLRRPRKKEYAVNGVEFSPGTTGFRLLNLHLRDFSFRSFTSRPEGDYTLPDS